MRLCTIEGCAGKHKGYGYCDKHYQRLKRHGDVSVYFKKKNCSVDGCVNDYYGNGLCNKHYLRKKCHNDLDHDRQPKYQTMADAYEAHVDRKKSNECWGWKGRKDCGYGVLQYTHEKKSFRAHRASYIIHKGEIPEGMFVCHHCDNPPCTNPDHLFLGSNIDNIMDCVSKGRNARGERNGHSKITTEEAVLIRLLLVSGNKSIAISNLLNISHSIVRGIEHRRTWRHIK